jgi:hypothetical protein
MSTDTDTAAGTATGTDTASATGTGTAGHAGSGAGTGDRARLIERDRAERYQDRWNELKASFVDEPKSAVRGANELVGEVLDELDQLFKRQRSEIEQGVDNDQASTEDLRVALGNYRSFFDRLLSL